MAKVVKKRVSITVSAEQFDRVSALLDEGGFPRGYLSYFLDRCISDLEDTLVGYPHEEMTALEEVHYEMFEQRSGKKKTDPES